VNFETLLVAGDSVAGGGGDDAGGWPHRLREGLALPERALTVDARTARTMVHVEDHLEAILDGAGDRPLVLVHVGHNDPQDGDDGPRVTEREFVAAARAVDRALAADPTVADHAFVAPVPLVALSRADAVPVSEAATERSRRYERRLAESVETYVGLGADPATWADRTADGVHPGPAGHRTIADRVLAWIRDRDQ
jgi:lysophospholipase L1-like esterase